MRAGAHCSGLSEPQRSGSVVRVAIRAAPANQAVANSSRLCKFHRTYRRRADSSTGYSDREARTAERRVAEIDPAASTLEDQPHEGQTDPGAVRLGIASVAEREDALAVGGGDPGAVVVDGEPNEARIVHVHADEDPAARLAVLHGIVDQVDEHERQPVRIDADAQRGRVVELDRNAARRLRTRLAQPRSPARAIRPPVRVARRACRAAKPLHKAPDRTSSLRRLPRKSRRPLVLDPADVFGPASIVPPFVIDRADRETVLRAASPMERRAAGGSIGWVERGVHGGVKRRGHRKVGGSENEPSHGVSEEPLRDDYLG